MLVPGHVVALFLATGGQNGNALGCDEKEAVLLVYVIIEVATESIVGIKQYLVRPESPLIVNNACSADQQQQQQNHNTSSSQSPTPSLDGTVSTAGDAMAGTECPITEALAAQILHSGRPLREVIDEFDSYIRSLSIDPSSPAVRLVTDGQLPLRQSLHPEACTKDIKLPAYYWRFCDLRKEFARFKSGDASQGSDGKTSAATTQLPSSINEMYTELELKPETEKTDFEFYIREPREMVAVVQALLSKGHKFDGVEPINLSLEPGICSIDDKIDGNCIVRARGLPWQSSDQDIAKFFRGLNVAKGGVALCLSPQGRRNGEALVRFVSQEHRDMALKRHKHHIGNRYIEVYRASGDDFLSVAGGASNEAQTFLSKGAQVIIRMRGLPYDCTAKQVLEFFSNGENPCNVLDGVDGVLFVKKPDGRATGDAFVLFASESDAPHALSRHRESIGQRYIELFRSTTAEVQQVLNRSLDPKTYEPPPPPLISQLPTVQMPLLPQTPFQHVITSGTSKDCIRLRGLPFEAKVENILQFLDDFAKNIVFQGVHMVYNAQGQPSGEAFIQMDSEASAFSSAQKKHHKYMVFGKKQRYIEVFQCSGDDMNMVLTGGIHSPANSKQPLLSPGMLHSPPTPHQAGSLHHQHQQPPPSSGQLQHSPAQHSAGQLTAGLPPQLHSPLSLSIPPPNSALLAQQQAQYIAQQTLLARQNAAAAAAAQEQMYQNFAFLPPHHQAQLQSQSHQYAAHYAAAAAAQGGVPGATYLFAPRPLMSHPHFQQMQQMGYYPNAMHPQLAAQYAAAAAAASAGQSPLTGVPPPTATSSAAGGAGGVHHQSVKRSYDHAFHNDPSAVNSASKRTYPPMNSAAASAYYSQFYPPSM